MSDEIDDAEEEHFDVADSEDDDTEERYSNYFSPDPIFDDDGEEVFATSSTTSIGECKLSNMVSAKRVTSSEETPSELLKGFSQFSPS